MRQRHIAGLIALVAITAAATAAHGRPSGFGGRSTALDTLSHRFESLPDGGRIEIQTAATDSVAVANVRHHLRAMAHHLAAADSAHAGHAPRAHAEHAPPAHGEHAPAAPELAVLASMAGRIEFVHSDLPAGAALQLVAQDADVIDAIHDFIEHLTQHHAGHTNGEHGSRMHGLHAIRGHSEHRM